MTTGAIDTIDAIGTTVLENLAHLTFSHPRGPHEQCLMQIRQKGGAAQFTLINRQSRRLSGRCTTSMFFFIAHGMIWLCSGM